MFEDLFALDPVALVSGVAAAGCLIAAPVFASRHIILVAQLCAGLAFATHYALLGITVASLANVLGAVQTAAAIFAIRSRAMDRLGYVLIVLMVGVGLWFWQGPISLLSVAATTALALGRMQSDTLRLRLLVLLGGGLWTWHDVLASAWIPLAADIGALVAGLGALMAMHVRIRIEWSAPRRPLPAI